MGEIGRWLEEWATRMPGGIGSRLRSAHWRKYLAACGPGLGVGIGARYSGPENIRFGSGVQIGLLGQIYASGGQGERIVLGDRVLTNSNVMVNADLGGVIEIGNDVIVGPNVVMRASNHVFDDRTKAVAEQGHRPGKITVGDDVWIGANAVLLPDISIGRGAIVGAGAVVTHDVEEWAIVAGVPAVRIGTRGTREDG